MRRWTLLWKSVRPVQYDIALKTKYTQDAVSGQMLDTIFGNLTANACRTGEIPILQAFCDFIIQKTGCILIYSTAFSRIRAASSSRIAFSEKGSLMPFTIW